ncbi:MAG: hypothetical protein PUD17_10840 [Treponema sp.]|uniref:hypothetical protein n=1 Tax=Treponema sp. TaxID=166 RepID=UPI00298E39E2|nr:hypothetical protein [Treponema sp.]MDD5812574.1 hypothetical protein [Treponema sp.]
MTLKKLSVFVLVLSFAVSAFAAKDTTQFKKDNILVEYVPHNGGVFLYYVDDDGKKTPVLDTVDYGTSSFVGVLIDKNYFNIRTSGGVAYKCEAKEDRLSVVYNIAKKVQLTVTYTVPQKNLLNIKYDLKNLDGTEHSVSLKSIFDTSLGEWNGTLFSTESKQKIKSEYIITDYQKHKTLTSSDGEIGIRFMMDKDFEKYAYKTVIAAKPFFETDSFDSYFVEGRGFNTVLSYNNSCVGFFFKSRVLKKDKDISFSQRIEFSKAIITSFKEIEDESDLPKFEENENEAVKADEKTEVILPDQTSVDSTTKKEEVVSVEQEIDYTPVFENISAKDSTVEKPVKTVDRQRALEIINRIKNLEDSGKNTDRREIMQLQRELTEILKCLKGEQ